MNAGHCAPLVVSPDGEMRTLETTGMPLGLIPGASFPVMETQLALGDKIVIYSDGVTEARGPDGEFYGVDRLLRVVEAQMRTPPVRRCTTRYSTTCERSRRTLRRPTTSRWW